MYFLYRAYLNSVHKRGGGRENEAMVIFYKIGNMQQHHATVVVVTMPGTMNFTRKRVKNFFL